MFRNCGNLFKKKQRLFLITSQKSKKEEEKINSTIIFDFALLTDTCRGSQIGAHRLVVHAVITLLEFYFQQELTVWIVQVGLCKEGMFIIFLELLGPYGLLKIYLFLWILMQINISFCITYGKICYQILMYFIIIKLHLYELIGFAMM